MISSFEVRPGTTSDIENMALVTERASAARAGEEIPTVLSVGSQDYADLCERREYQGYWSHLAFDGSRLAGFVAGYPGNWKGEDEGANSEYLWLLMVDPDYQRRGLGKTLLRLAASQATEDGRDAMVLYTTTDNMTARHLYESENYQQIGTTMSQRQGKLIKYLLELKTQEINLKK